MAITSTSPSASRRLERSWPNRRRPGRRTELHRTRTLSQAHHTMSLTRSCAFALALLLAAAPAARAQDACNAPAKDAIVHLDVPGTPFEPVITADGCWLFVTLAAGNRPDGGDIAVVRRDAGQLSVGRTFPVKGNPPGPALTHDGKTLIVASGAYLAFLDASRLISGAGDPVLGYIGNGSPVGVIYLNVNT